MKTYRFKRVPITLRLGGSPGAQLEMWVQGLGNLLDGLIMLASFGCLIPGFALRLSCWRLQRDIQRQKQRHHD
jgi:hypothetical protein